MQGAVYLLCAATALICCTLLLRGYQQNRVWFLLWCGLCFLALTLENVVLFIDLVLIPQTDLADFRNLAALAGVVVLLYGLVWEVK